jgi:Uma2 family endonuclease
MGSVCLGRTARAVPEQEVLSLVNGDRMSQPEFHRRYLTRPDHEKWELIGGVVFMASPLGRPHGYYHPHLSGPMWLYMTATPGIELLDNATTILGEESEPQPDLELRILPAYGGQSRDTADNYVGGAPELVVEIAHSNRAIALGAKHDDYKQAGVLEYVVLCVEEQKIHWFDFRTGRPIRPTRQGVYRSRVFPGLWIDGVALLARDSRRLVEVIQQGLASPEHARFVKRLQVEWRKRSPK